MRDDEEEGSDDDSSAWLHTPSEPSLNHPSEQKFFGWCDEDEREHCQYYIDFVSSSEDDTALQPESVILAMVVALASIYCL